MSSPTGGEIEVEFAGLSETGPVREQNEDHLGWGRVGGPGHTVGQRVLSGRCVETPGSGLVFAVADGLGGYGGGEVASALALRSLVEEAANSGPGPKPAALLRSAFDTANRIVFDAALSGQGSAKMQTTMTALALSPGAAHLAHIGDCRAYRLRGETLELVTTDHTQVMEMLRLRMLTPEQAAGHPARHALTRSLGADLIVRTDIRREVLQQGDTYLLCSDGLWGKVDAAEIKFALAGPLDQACHVLVGLALERGGEDNATMLALRVVAAGQAPPRPQGWRRLFLS